MIERIAHSVGVNSIRELIFLFIGVWLAIFIALESLLIPLISVGVFDFNTFFTLAPVMLLISLLLTLIALYIPVARKREDIEKNFPYFIVFMGSMTTAKASYDEFFKVLSETTEYGEISKEMKRLYHLATDWKLGYSKACKVVADTTPSPLFSNFMSRLSQVVEYGEDLVMFFQNQFKDILRDIQVQYQSSIHKISNVADLFSALFVAGAFLFAFLAMVPIFYPMPEDFIYLAYLLLVVVIDVLVITIARTSLPPDKLANDFPNVSPEHMYAIYAAAAGSLLSVLIFLSGFFLNLEPIVQVALSVVPLIYPAYLAWRAERLIKQREHSYLPFIRTLGELVYIREGAIIPVIRRLRRHIYPGMNRALERLYRRLAITRNVFQAFRLFSKELGSAVLTKFNELFVKTLYAGANPKTVGSIIGDQLHTLLDSRKLREHVSSSAKGTIYGTYWGVALGVFLAVKSLAAIFIIFGDVFASVYESGVSQYIGNIFNLNVDLRPMVDALVYLFAVQAVFLAFLIKMLDGGLKVGALVHVVILIAGLMVVYYITDIAVSYIIPADLQVEITGQ